MLGWETAEQTRTDPRELEFARIWKAIPKVVFSTSLTTVEGNARLARRDLADEVAELKNQPGAGIVSVGGAGLAASLAGLAGSRSRCKTGQRGPDTRPQTVPDV